MLEDFNWFTRLFTYSSIMKTGQTIKKDLDKADKEITEMTIFEFGFHKINTFSHMF